MTRPITRRLVLGTAAAALPLPGLMRARGDTPEFEMKMGNDNPMTHPNTIRQQEAVDRILKETNGRVKISVFPNNQLGGDTDMLSQLRSGALEFMTLSGLILSTFTPLSSIYGIGYAFPNYKTATRTTRPTRTTLSTFAFKKSGAPRATRVSRDSTTVSRRE
jgi:TRAP-type C4-dicarboxylate transport system substrate-binding protein